MADEDFLRNAMASTDDDDGQGVGDESGEEGESAEADLDDI